MRLVHLVDVPVSSHRPFFNPVVRGVHVQRAHSPSRYQEASSVDSPTSPNNTKKSSLGSISGYGGVPKSHRAR